MALVKKIIWYNRDVEWRSETVCSVCVQKISGELFIQLNTYGSSGRKLKGQSSQAVTFDSENGILLRDLLLAAFPLFSTQGSLQTPNNTPNN